MVESSQGPNPQQDVDPQKLRRSRLAFLALVAIAAFPLLAAYGIYFFMPDLAPDTRSNEGQLITPPIDIVSLGGEAGNLAGKWTLLLPVRGERCDEQCEAMLYLARQVNVALGKESSRVQRALLQESPELASEFVGLIATEYPDMKRRIVPAAAFSALAGAVPGGALDHHIFVSDPNGNVMMVYSKDQTGGAMLDDLKKLLRLSNIG